MRFIIAVLILIIAGCISPVDIRETNTQTANIKQLPGPKFHAVLKKVTLMVIKQPVTRTG